MTLISAPYIFALALLLFLLSINVIRLRRKHKVKIFSGNKKELDLAIRAHGNFCEYSAFFLVLLIALEITDTAAWIIHSAALCFLLARCCHAYGLVFRETKIKSVSNFRVIGMALTFTAILFSASRLLGF